MKPELQRHAAPANKAKLIPVAQGIFSDIGEKSAAPTAGPAIRSWSAPDPGVFA